MVRHQGKHVMLNVVVHIPIEEAIQPIRQESPRIQTMIEHIFRQSGVLGEAVNKHQPRSKYIGQANE